MSLEIQSLGPWLFLACGILGTLLVSVVRPSTKRPAQISALLTLLGTAILAVRGLGSDSLVAMSGTFEISQLTHGFLAAVCGLGILFILGTGHYLTRERIHLSDYYHLLLVLILGASILVASKHLVVTFIALEVMSLAAYTLAGFRRNDSRSNEAAIKYFILGGAMAAVYLLGVSFVFGATGSMQLGAIYEWSKSSSSGHDLFRFGHLMLVLSFLFKVAAAPLHFWKPDVYEGAPTPVTGIMASVITSAAFLTLIRLVHLVDFGASDWVSHGDLMKGVLRVSAAASLIVGSMIMITQKNLKRMLAYSSITHSGYLLLGALGTFSPALEISSMLIYLGGYAVMSTGVFVLLTVSCAQADTGVELIDLTGLMKRAPFLTLLWIVFLLSMAGMPFTVGFFTKYFVFIASLGSNEVGLVILAAICTVVGAYAYLRPIALMTMRDAAPGASDWRPTLGSQMVVVTAAAAVLVLGIAPNPVIHFLKGISLIH